MSKSPFVNDFEYSHILQRVNQVICEYSRSTTDQTNEAEKFLQAIAEKCSTREEYLKLIEQRLDLISNPVRIEEVIQWFKEKRTGLSSLLQKIKEKLSKDPTYLSKYSSSFVKGLQCLDRLLKVNENLINQTHAMELNRVKKMVMEIKGETENKMKAQEIVSQQLPPADPFFLYSTLHDIVNIVNISIIQNNTTNAEETKKVIDVLHTHKASILTYLNTYKDQLDSAHSYRLNTAITLTEIYLIHMNNIILQETSSHNNNTEDKDSSDHAPILPPALSLTSIYAILSELKAVEWKYIQQLHTYNKTTKDSNSNNSSSSTTIPQQLECFTQICKKRKASVAIDGMPKLSSSNTTTTKYTTSTTNTSTIQKHMDQLQQYYTGIESTDLVDGRILHCRNENQGNRESFLSFDWNNYVDMNTQQSDIVTLLLS